jgi:hypothetical protein
MVAISHVVPMQHRPLHSFERVNVLSALEGAMILSINLDDKSMFESVAKSLTNLTDD